MNDGKGFNLHQRVYVKELAVTGRIVAKFEADSGVQYKVRYFHNGTEQMVYFYADELSAGKS